MNSKKELARIEYEHFMNVLHTGIAAIAKLKLQNKQELLEQCKYFCDINQYKVIVVFIDGSWIITELPHRHYNKQVVWSVSTQEIPYLRNLDGIFYNNIERFVMSEIVNYRSSLEE